MTQVLYMVTDFGLQGTNATKCVQLWRPLRIGPDIAMKGFGNMKKLRFLSMVSIKSSSDVDIDQVNQSFPNALRFLSWEGYPHSCLPTIFEANNLVELHMPYSRITQLWDGGERKVQLKLHL